MERTLRKAGFGPDPVSGFLICHPTIIVTTRSGTMIYCPAVSTVSRTKPFAAIYVTWLPMKDAPSKQRFTVHPVAGSPSMKEIPKEYYPDATHDNEYYSFHRHQYWLPVLRH